MNINDLNKELNRINRNGSASNNDEDMSMIDHELDDVSMDDRELGRSYEQEPVTSSVQKVVVNHRYPKDVATDVLKHFSVKYRDRVYLKDGKFVELHYKDGQASLISIDRERLRKLISDSVQCIKLDKKSREEIVHAPTDLLRYIEASSSDTDFPIRQLSVFTGIPILTARDSSLLTTPGYDEATKTLYIPNAEIPVIPSAPTGEEVRSALDTIRAPLAEYPFIDEASYANYLAALLTPMVRNLYLAPMFLIKAPDIGSGKSHLAEYIGMIPWGIEPHPIKVNDDNEVRKQITAAMRCSQSNVLSIDNHNGGLESRSLCQALTSWLWGDRQIMTSNTVLRRQNFIWVANGNGLHPSSDMCRRVVTIELDAKVPHPHLREFKVKDIQSHVRTNRGNILAALATLVTNWIHKDRPLWDGKPMGSFEMWCQTIGGILKAAGLNGFLANYQATLDEFKENDLIIGGWLEAIYLHTSGKKFTRDQLAGMIRPGTNGSLYSKTPEEIQLMIKSQNGWDIKLGHKLRGLKGKRFIGNEGTYQVKSERNTSRSASDWNIVRFEASKTAA